MSTEFGAAVVHFASPDFSREAIVVVRYDDPDEAIKITLRPVRLVRAQVLEMPKDRSREPTCGWDVYSLDRSAGKLDEIPAIGRKGHIG